LVSDIAFRHRCIPLRHSWPLQLLLWAALLVAPALLDALPAQAARPAKASARSAVKAAAKGPAKAAKDQGHSRTPRAALHPAKPKGKPKAQKATPAREERPASPPAPKTAPPAAAPKAASPGSWSELHVGVQRFRVGQLERAAQALLPLAGASQEEIAASAALVMGRIAARQGDGAEALRWVNLARPMAKWLPASWRWAHIEAQRAAGKSAEALQELRDMRQDHPEFRWAAADLWYSRLYEQVGPAQQAADAALQLYEKSALHLPRDELLARAARTTETFARDKAALLWRRLLVKHPESPLVAEAVERVDPAVFTQDEQFERMVLLFQRRAYERCRSIGLSLWVKGFRRAEVGFYLGKIGSERLRDDYPGAAKYLAEAIADGEPLAQQALLSYALVLAKLGRHADSVARYDEWLQKNPGVPNDRRIDAHYDRGRVLHAAGRSLQAADDLTAALDENERNVDSPKYRWFTAFWAYLGGKPELAVERLKPMLANSNPLVGGKAMYWTARALDKLERRAEAAEMLQKVLVRHPLTWYSGLAEQRLSEWGMASKLPPTGDFSKIIEKSADPFDGLSVTDESRVLRLACSIGEPDACQNAFDEHEKALRKQLGPEDFERLRGELADPLERYSDAREAALKRDGQVLNKLPTRETLAAWRAIYPRAFATHVEASSRRNGAPEWMIYAHMLQESRYKPWLISGAPAYGLLELLDRTAARLAQESGDDYQLWMLMQPAWNVRWGGQYLGALYRKFHRQLPFAVASYNGGPMLMEGHVRAQARMGRPYDEMIEDLGPHESRNYVRMVSGWMLRYLAIYEEPRKAAELKSRLLPLVWTADFLPDPDY
jgi:soluble lytic murein transglycosylase-like protein